MNQLELSYRILRDRVGTTLACLAITNVNSLEGVTYVFMNTRLYDEVHNKGPVQQSDDTDKPPACFH